MWQQNYDPFNNPWLSTAVAALPVVVLLGMIGWFHVRIHVAAVGALILAFVVAVFGFKMPLTAASAAAGYGAAFGLFPIGWIILNLIFLYTLTVEKGHFDVLRASLARIAPDPRVQLILIAFSFGAFFEGAAGFGTPVAVTAAILIQLGFKPLSACGLSLIANTAPVAFGALGTPIIALSGVTGIPETTLGAMAGRQLPFFSLLVPFWVVWAYAGWKRTIEVWPAALTAGVGFALPQYLVSNFHGPWLVDIVASLVSIGALILLLKFWKPREIIPTEQPVKESSPTLTREQLVRAWTPWLLLSVLVFIWGLKPLKEQANAIYKKHVPVPGLHQVVTRGPEVSADRKPEDAVYKFEILAGTGTGIFVAAIIAGLIMGYRPAEMARLYGRTVWKVRYSLVTIAGMLSLGYVTKYSGADATLGLALAKTGPMYPFFGTLLGWLGVALTGSDTASNVLFGSLQTITAEKVGVSPTLMAAANSTGGVMGKMVDAQSIVVASTATNWYGHEGQILRYVFFHSIALAAMVGIVVTLQAYVPPFTQMVVEPPPVVGK